MRKTPDMTGKASEIDDPIQLYARIGCRIFLAYRDGARSCLPFLPVATCT